MIDRELRNLILLGLGMVPRGFQANAPRDIITDDDDTGAIARARLPGRDCQGAIDQWQWKKQWTTSNVGYSNTLWGTE